jgi:hypothetical protein
MGPDATEADLVQWAALGGQVKETKKSKTFVAPSGSLL